MTVWTAEKLCSEMRQFAANGAKTIDIRITSGGGSLSSGLLIVDVMNELKENKPGRDGVIFRTIIEGAAASAATLVSVAASPGQRHMHASSRALLHNARAVLDTALKSTERDVVLADLKAQEEAAKKVYRKHCREFRVPEEKAAASAEATGPAGTKRQFRVGEKTLTPTTREQAEKNLDDAMRHDNWMSSETCLAYGIVDRIGALSNDKEPASLEPETTISQGQLMALLAALGNGSGLALVRGEESAAR